MQTASSSRPVVVDHTASSSSVPDRLDALLDLSPGELLELYREASVPRLEHIRGDLRGRMLAIPAVRGPVARLLRGLAGSKGFPWRGKSFTPRDTGRGEGINRVLSDRLKLFRFETSIGPSKAGDFDAVQLDYDHAGNPWFIRRIEDEIRELRPGLYLGQAWVRLRGGRPWLALYFGLESP